MLIDHAGTAALWTTECATSNIGGVHGRLDARRILEKVDYLLELFVGLFGTSYVGKGSMYAVFAWIWMRLAPRLRRPRLPMRRVHQPQSRKIPLEGQHPHTSAGRRAVTAGYPAGTWHALVIASPLSTRPCAKPHTPGSRGKPWVVLLGLRSAPVRLGQRSGTPAASLDR